VPRNDAGRPCTEPDGLSGVRSGQPLVTPEHLGRPRRSPPILARVQSAIALSLISCALPVSAGASQAAGTELTIVSWPERIAATSVAYVTLRVRNTGAGALRGCDRPQEAGAVHDRCVALGWKYWRAPSSPRLTSMDVVRGLPPNVLLEPGQSMEWTLRMETPRHRNSGPLNLYLFERDGPDVTAQHVVIPLEVGRAPSSRWPTMITVWALCASYIVAIGACLWSAVRGPRRRNLR